MVRDAIDVGGGWCEGSRVIAVVLGGDGVELEPI
jgi:hypothetical protein